MVELFDDVFEPEERHSFSFHVGPQLSNPACFVGNYSLPAHPDDRASWHTTLVSE